MKNGSKAVPKISHEEFVLKAIRALRKPPYQGIHTVYTGFNKAFREYFPGDDPVAITHQLAKKGVITIFLVRGGAIISPTGEVRLKATNVLQRVLTV